MTLNSLMVRLQSRSSEECGLPLHCHYSEVHSGGVAPDRVLSMGQIELFDHLTVCKQMTDV